MSEIEFNGCRQCGNCCRVAGYVRLRAGEVERIAACLRMGVHEFTDRYTRVTRDRGALSLTEQQDGSCVFLNGNICTIDQVKPVQCREFPVSWRFDGWRDVCAGKVDQHEK